MLIRFTSSARKHRVGKARVLSAMESAGEPARIRASDGDEADRLLWIGIDNRGVELEVVAIEQPYGLLVIHAMPTFYRRKRE